MTSARWPPAKSPICRRTAAILLMDKGADHQLDAPLDGLLGRTSRRCSPGWLRINMPPRQGPLLLQAEPRCMRSALEACGTFRQPWGGRTQRLNNLASCSAAGETLSGPTSVVPDPNGGIGAFLCHAGVAVGCRSRTTCNSVRIPLGPNQSACRLCSQARICAGD